MLLVVAELLPLPATTVYPRSPGTQRRSRTYFARRYAGLSDLFGGSVRWDMERLVKFPALAASWRSSKDPKSRPSDSEARTALQVKFTVTLEFESVGGVTEQASAQFIWRYDPKWITGGLVETGTDSLVAPSPSVALLESVQAVREQSKASTFVTFGRSWLPTAGSVGRWFA